MYRDVVFKGHCQGDVVFKGHCRCMYRDVVFKGHCQGDVVFKGHCRCMYRDVVLTTLSWVVIFLDLIFQGQYRECHDSGGNTQR